MSITNEDKPFEIEVRVVDDDDGFVILIRGFPSNDAADMFSGWLRTMLEGQPPPPELMH